MKRISVLCLAGILTLLVAMPAGAAHGPTFTASDNISVGNPASSTVGGVTENLASCDPASGYNGLDGIWYDIQGFASHTATLTMGSNADFDAWWYDDTCAFIDDASMAQGFLGTTESAPAPANARYVIVDLYAGGNESFTLTIGPA